MRLPTLTDGLQSSGWKPRKAGVGLNGAFLAASKFWGTKKSWTVRSNSVNVLFKHEDGQLQRRRVGNWPFSGMLVGLVN